MSTRLQRLAGALEAAGAAAYVAALRPNQLYFVSAAEPVSDLPPVAYVLLAPPDVVVVPGAPFYYACRDHLPGVELAPTEVGGLDATDALALEIRRRGFGSAILDTVSRETEAALRAALFGVDLVLDASFGALLRRPKEPGELETIRAAAAIADQGMIAAFRAARPGVGGRDIAAEATAVMLRAGAEDADLQVAVGPATAYMGTGDWVYAPRRALQPGDILLVDMALKYHGYLGDQTRTAIVGDVRPEQLEIIRTVQEAYRATIAAMCPGATSPNLYAITTDLLQRRGWRRYFPHHISHGLGLGGDLPRISATSTDVLQVGDALSCEPGVYIPGVGGARFENMLYLGPDGVEELTHSPVDPVVGG
jgi:Xaa-Pro aminopeptidase